MKKDGSAIISAIMILFLMSLIGCLYYRMAYYNIQLKSLNFNHSDKYSMSKEEEEVIYKFMKRINKIIHEYQKDEESPITEEMLCNIELPLIDKSLMKYEVETHRFIFTYHIKDGIEKSRDINYKVNGNKVILIPMHILEERNFDYNELNYERALKESK